MKTVYLNNNVVTEVIPEYGLPVEKWYGVSFASHCITTDNDNVKQHWIYSPETNQFSPPIEVDIVNEAKSIKIPELSNACNEAINAGTTIQFSNGPSEMFTYNIDDQSNISEMTNAMIMGATSYPYHASGSDCRMYSKDEIVQIYSTLSALKTHHLTYYNQLRAYVNSLTSAEEVYNVQYGQELTGAYLDTYNTLMQQAVAEMNKVVEKMKNETTNS